MSTTPCSIYDTVQSAFAVNNLSVLKECWADLLREIIGEIDAISESSIEQLLGAQTAEYGNAAPEMLTAKIFSRT